MQSPFRNMSAFIDIVHEKYPEINLEVIPYSGKNYTTYVKAELAADDMPDIYTTSYFIPDLDDVSSKLIALSSYAFTDNYAEARLRDVTDSKGAIHLLPTYYDCLGITYNKTLLKKTAGRCRPPSKSVKSSRPRSRQPAMTCVWMRSSSPATVSSICATFSTLAGSTRLTAALGRPPF